MRVRRLRQPRTAGGTQLCVSLPAEKVWRSCTEWGAALRVRRMRCKALMHRVGGCTAGAQVQAEVLLLKAALDDPANARFVLLSETCIPLYPATVVWAQLLGERKSRVNACRHPEEPRDEEFRMTYR